MFKLIERRPLPDIKSVASRYRHEPTGAELVSVENDDENKVFGITFRTPPSDSTGVAHILEHSVLCGSRKYPVKEPFVELLKGSLQTFLNAFTYPDKTCYPVASQNVRDFYNLIDVYMDAALYPLLTRHTHAQEAWHYEIEKPDAPLAFKGVVFNEMKGVYSSPDSALAQFGQETLFPDITYGLDYGGRPAHIPDLTYEQLCDFHHRYYHPSNARIWFYGDDDPARRLEIMEDWLKPFSRQSIQSGVPLQPRFERPRTAERFFQGGPDARAMTVFSWLLHDTTNIEAGLAWEVLAHILIGTPASPLRKALIESGLGEDLAGIGLENQLRQSYFSTGLKGVEVPNIGTVETLIFQTLEKLERAGLDPRTVAASLNTIEFRLRENNTGNYPRGLSAMIRSLGVWLYDGDPFAPLAFTEPLRRLREEAGRGLFERMIREQLLDNPHRVRLDLKPDTDHATREESAERKRLDDVRATLSDDAVDRLIAETQELKRAQAAPDRPEDLARIPRLQLADLPRGIKVTPCFEERLSEVPLYRHELTTNGIAYVDIGFDLNPMPDALLPYAGILGRAMLEMGTEKEDFVSLDQRIGSETGGIEDDDLFVTHTDARTPIARLFLRGKVMADRPAPLFDILRDVLTLPRFDDRERFRQIVLEEKAGLEADLIPSGHSIVNTRLRAKLTTADALADRAGGIGYLAFLRDLATRMENDWPSALTDLRAAHAAVVSRANAVVQLTTDASAEGIRPLIEDLLASLPTGTRIPAPVRPPLPPDPEGLAVPSQVNYVGMAGGLFDLGYQLHGSSLVITRHLRNAYLWDRVRVQGGAYGGMCWFDTRSGILSLVSYRDPNLEKTWDVYRAIADYLRRLHLSDDELTKAIVGAVGDLDQYQLPDARGYSSMVRKLVADTDERRQRLRDEVLGTTLRDFHAFGDALAGFEEKAVVAALGSPETLSRPGRLVIRPLLA